MNSSNFLLILKNHKYHCKKIDLKVLKPFVYIILFHISLGILLPSLAFINSDLIESSIALVSLEGDHELEEKKSEKKIYDKLVSLEIIKIDSRKILIHNLTKDYQSVYLNSFSPPPEI